MAAFKLTYGTMFNPPEELHAGFDKAVKQLKSNLGKEYGMIIDGKDVFADQKFEDHSPVNTDWILALMQKGNATHAEAAIAAARRRSTARSRPAASRGSPGPRAPPRIRAAAGRRR